MGATNTSYRATVQVASKMISSTLGLLFLALVLLACSRTPVTEAPRESTTNGVSVITATLDISIPTVMNTVVSSSTPTLAATPTQLLDSIPETLFYNLPPATLTSATGLYVSPNRAEPVVPVPIPAGETVYVMGRNKTGSHLRVVWNTGVGWVPVSFTDYNGRQDKMKPLPVFTREPPACAVPVTTQFGLSSKWISEEVQRIAVVVDLFRSRYGDFPRSYLSLAVNGSEVRDSRRQIVEQGQFSLKDVVFTLPADVQPEDTVGYFLETSSDEQLTFMATIFQVPRNCKWDID